MAHHTNSITIKILRDWSVLNFLVAISIICIPLAFDPYFYFNDDVQTQYIPVYREIGAAYARLELPLLSGQIFHGDNFLLEYQYGLFNPVSIIISVLIYIVHRGDLGVDIFAGAYIFILFYGVVFFGRKIGLRAEYATIAATATCCLPWIVYVNARAWIPGLAAFAYFPWILGFLMQFVFRSRGMNAVAGLAASVFLLLTAGWPHTVIAAGLASIAISIVAIRRSRKPLRTTLALGVGLGSGALLAMPASLPLLAAFAETARVNWEPAASNYHVSLEGFLAASALTYLPVAKTWTTLNNFPFPVYFIGIFFVPFTIGIFMSKTKILMDTIFVSMIAVISLLMFLILLPDLIGPLQVTMRWTIHVQLIIIMLLSLIIQRHYHSVEKHFLSKAAAFYFLYVVMLSFKEFPIVFMYHLFFGAISLAAVLGIVTYAKTRRAFAVSCIATSIISHAIIVGGPIASFHNIDFYVSTRQEPLGVASLANGTTLVLDQDSYWGPMLQGRKGVIEPSAAIGGDDRRVMTGYGPVGHKNFKKFMCMTLKGALECPDVIDRVFSMDASLGVRATDLFKVAHVIVEKDSPYFDKPNPILIDEFVRVGETDGIIQWDRKAQLTLPGTLSFLPEGYGIRGSEASGTSHEKFTLVGGSDKDGTIVFSRLFWQGYQITLNGTPLKVGSWNGILLSAELPKFSAGVLEIRYVPAGLIAGLVMALMGLLILIGFLLLSAKFLPNTRMAKPEPA